MKIAILGWDSRIWKPAYSRRPRGAVKSIVLGWGPLRWNPKQLQLADDKWHRSGPLLPIDFGRISEDLQEQQLTPVLVRGAKSVRVLWARSAFDQLDRARQNLAALEKIHKEQIGYVRRGDEGLEARSQLSALTNAEGLVRRIDSWREERGFDAVIWIDLPANFEQQRKAAGHEGPLNPDNVVEYLSVLVESDSATAAEDSIRRAPAQIRTAIRTRIEEFLAWQPLPTYAITDPKGLSFAEWTECRATIGRLDTILVDLRKLGFSFITALLTASAFLSLLGIPTAQNVPVAPSLIRAAPFLSIVVLITALFFVDSYYEILLSGAVERTLDLEAQTDPPVRVTKYISTNAALSLASAVTLLLYLFLLLVACGLGVFGVIATAKSSGNPPVVTSFTFEWNLMAAGIAGAGVVVGLIMFGYWLIIGGDTGVHNRKPGRQWRPGEGPLAKIDVP